MARLARVVIPGLAHHVTQRGNGRRQVFFSDADYALYLRLLRAASVEARVSCHAYCLMPNHVHLILVPTTTDSLRQCLASVHHAYAVLLNRRRRVSGHFWQGRYGSVPMDDAHLFEALRYVLLNPVRAGLVRVAAEWRWSSARVFLDGAVDGVTDSSTMLRRIPDMRAFLGEAPDDVRIARLRAAETIGRPVASREFVQRLEADTGRCLTVGRRGRRFGEGSSSADARMLRVYSQQ